MIAPQPVPAASVRRLPALSEARPVVLRATPAALAAPVVVPLQQGRPEERRRTSFAEARAALQRLGRTS